MNVSEKSLPSKNLVNDVHLFKIKNLKDDITDSYIYICHFCNKNFKIEYNNRISCKNLSGTVPHCSFCLRNDFHHRSNKNVLMMSFRSIFALYYYQEYINKKNVTFNEIAYMMDCHEYCGLKNPALYYDNETFMWFVNFNKIGNSQRKVPIDDVLNTTYEIIYSTQVSKFRLKAQYLDLFYEKYKEAIVKFYENRIRPPENKILIPTFHGIFNTTKQFNSVCKAFSKNHFYPIPSSK